MIDPKLNDIPVPASATSVGETEEGARSARTRPGLSINDTVAGDTVLSSGSRGVDTSGVSVGAGAGAGFSAVTPGGVKESPAPEIVSGARSAGTTAGGGPNPTQLADAPLESSTGTHHMNTSEVAERAYHIWYSRGCPEGTAEEDWHQAERELATERAGARSRTAGSI
jgi:Protein of unknown function (DUF2934)